MTVPPVRLRPVRIVRFRCGCGVSTVRPVVHHIHPMYLDGADVPSNRVRICGRCHNDAHELLDRLLARPVDQDEAALVRPYPRRLAYEGHRRVTA